MEVRMRYIALTLAGVLAAGAAQAEDVAGPLPQTIRVLLRNQDTLQGYLRGRSKDEVVIYTSEGRFRHVPFADVQRLDVRSRTGTQAKRGALIGALLWAGAAAAASRGAPGRGGAR